MKQFNWRKSLQFAFAAIILTVFLLSIMQVAFAENNYPENEKKEKEIKFTISNAEKIANASTAVSITTAQAQAAEHKDVAEENETDDNEEEESETNESVFDKADRIGIKAEQQLEKARAQIMNAREDYLQAKEKYIEAKQHHVEQKEMLVQMKTIVKQCKSNTEECQNKKLDLKLGYYNYLLRVSDVVGKFLEKLESRINDDTELSPENKEKALGKVTALKERLALLQEKIDAFTAETSKEEINAAVTELKDIKSGAQDIQKMSVAMLMNAKLEKIVEKHDEYRNGMEMRIKALEDQSANVAELKKLLEKFDEKSAELKEDYETAKNMWERVETAKDFSDFVQDVHKAQMEVRNDLKETKEILKEFLAQYREIKKDLEPAENTNTTLEE